MYTTATAPPPQLRESYLRQPDIDVAVTGCSQVSLSLPRSRTDRTLFRTPRNWVPPDQQAPLKRPTAASPLGQVPVWFQVLPPRFLVWRHRNQNKPPIDGRSGISIDPHDQANHLSLDEAIEYVETGRADGIGFALSSELGLVCIDVDEGASREQREAIQSVVGDAYAEQSPSGKGLHYWLRTDQGFAINTHPEGVGIYSDRQYITLTGWQESRTSNDLHYVDPETIQALAFKLRGKQAKAQSAPIHGDDSDHNGWVDIDLEKVEEAALSAKSKDGMNVIKHKALLHGGWKGHYKYLGHALFAAAGRCKHWIWRTHGVESGDDVVQGCIEIIKTMRIYKDYVRERGQRKAAEAVERAALKAKVLKSFYTGGKTSAAYPVDGYLNCLADCLSVSDLDHLRKGIKISFLVLKSGKDRTTCYRWLKKTGACLTGKTWTLDKSLLKALELRMESIGKVRWDREEGCRCIPPKSMAATFDWTASPLLPLKPQPSQSKDPYDGLTGEQLVREYGVPRRFLAEIPNYRDWKPTRHPYYRFVRYHAYPRWEVEAWLACNGERVRASKVRSIRLRVGRNKALFWRSVRSLRDAPLTLHDHLIRQFVNGFNARMERLQEELKAMD